MKYFILAILILVTMISCGAGNIGKLGIYTFCVSKDSLETVMNKLLDSQKNTIQKIENIPLYSLKGTGYENTFKTFIVDSENEKFICRTKFHGDSLYWKNHANSSALTLVYMARFGDTLKGYSDINQTRKEHFEKVFQTFFLKRLMTKVGNCPLSNAEILK